MFAQQPTATGAWDLISSRIPLLGTLTVWAVAIQVTILIFLLAYKSVKSRGGGGGGGGGLGLSQMKSGKVLMGVILLLNIPVAMQAIDWVSILVGTTIGNELDATSPDAGIAPADADADATAPAGAEAGGG